MLKEIAVELADLVADVCKRRARKWVARSQWWADLAEAMESGTSLKKIRGRKDAAS